MPPPAAPASAAHAITDKSPGTIEGIQVHLTHLPALLPLPLPPPHTDSGPHGPRTLATTCCSGTPTCRTWRPCPPPLTREICAAPPTLTPLHCQAQGAHACRCPTWGRSTHRGPEKPWQIRLQITVWRSLVALHPPPGGSGSCQQHQSLPLPWIHHLAQALDPGRTVGVPHARALLEDVCTSISRSDTCCCTLPALSAHFVYLRACARTLTYAPRLHTPRSLRVCTRIASPRHAARGAARLRSSHLVQWEKTAVWHPVHLISVKYAMEWRGDRHATRHSVAWIYHGLLRIAPPRGHGDGHGTHTARARCSWEVHKR